MLKSLFCAAVIFVFVLSLCLLPQAATARRCPVKEPETLLSLYQNSDGIYVATFDKTTEGEVVESNDDYSVREIHKHFTISSTLKGESRKFFVLDDREYTYKSAVPEPEVESAEEPEATDSEDEPEAAEEEDTNELKSGDSLLLFIRNGNEEEGPALTDYRDGIKRLPMEKIAVYEERIRDLNSIFGSKKVSGTQLLDWLIRCAGEPITRWEGTYELLRSVQNEEWRQKAVERRRESAENGASAEGESEESVVSAREEPEQLQLKNFDTRLFAKMLDINHKQTLANILLNHRGGAADGEGREPVRGDRELIELVKRWGDPRFLGFLIDKLRAGSDDAGTNADTMSIVAEILGDEKAAALAEKYRMNAYEDDDEVVEPEESEEVEAEETTSRDREEEGTLKAETAPAPVEREDPVNTVKSEAGHAAPEVRRQTHKELRTELMQKFLTRCDEAIARKDGDKDLKSAH